MDSLNRALSEYAAYFGIVAAFLSLASWLASNYFGERAKSASESLRQAESEFQVSRNFRRVYDLINEETQTLDHVYRDIRKLSSQQQGSSTQADRGAERYNTLMRLGYTRHGDRAVFSELERANQLANLVGLLDLPDDSLTAEATKARDDVQTVYNQRLASQKKISDAIDTAGDVYQIDDAAWNIVEAAIKEHRELAEIKLIPEQNRISSVIANLESKILDGQRQELSHRNTVSAVVKRVAFALYITSAILALYGKWLDVRYPQPKTEIVQVVQEPSGKQADKTE